MRFVATAFLVTNFALCIGCASTSEEEPAGAVALFNGENLDGWSCFLVDPAVTMEDVWSVKDGAIVCKGDPLGYLCTEKDYTSFGLAFEWRWAPGKEPGNSGVLMRITGDPMGLPRCMESQLKNGSAGDLYGFHGFKIDGDPARTSKTPNHERFGLFTAISKIEANEKEPGEWNRCEITVDGGNVVVVVNGKEVNRAKDAELVAGKIGFQSEGGEIHFRTIELTPIE